METEEHWRGPQETMRRLSDTEKMARLGSGCPRVQRQSSLPSAELLLGSLLEGESRLLTPNVCNALQRSVLTVSSGRVDKPFLKAGRKFHAMKAKRNSWPRTRGVAMNPVDRELQHTQDSVQSLTRQIPTVVVIINISEKLLPSPDSLLLVKRVCRLLQCPRSVQS